MDDTLYIVILCVLNLPALIKVISYNLVLNLFVIVVNPTIDIVYGNKKNKVKKLKT